MTQDAQMRIANARTEAAAWLLRVRDAEASADDWAALADWLEAAPENLAAFERAEALLEALDDQRHALLAAVPETTNSRGRGRARRSAWLIGGLAAACLLLAIPIGWRAVAGVRTDYQTAKGETRKLVLADGTRIALNSGSRLSVRIGLTARHVWMDQAEASFDVAHDAARPFLIDVGDQQVRVVGTEFNIRHYDGATIVSVRRGAVEVSPLNDAAAGVRLVGGDSLRHVEGADSLVRRVSDIDAAFSWSAGQIICDDEPLSDLIAALNHRYSTRIALSPDLADLRFSGVLQLRGQAETLQVLANYLSLKLGASTAGFELSRTAET